MCMKRLGTEQAAGSTSASIVLTVNGDNVWEPNEDFSVELTSWAGFNLADKAGTVTITNDDKPVAAVQTAASVTEGNSGSKTVTLTSTYDHRIIQGAESGLFLKKVHELLLGEDDFYVDIFRSFNVPYEAVKWRKDVNPIDHEQVLLEKQMQVQTLINTFRVRGHLIADLDPLAWKEPKTHPELDPAYYGLTIWDLQREFLILGLGGTHAQLGQQRRMRLEDILKQIDGSMTFA